MKKSGEIFKDGWNWTKSFLSYVKGVLFSEAASPDGQLASRLGLDQLILSKRYWVDRQRETFASLSYQVSSETISADTLQAALSEISDKIGAKLGSPALMYNELKRLKGIASDTKLLVVIESTHIDLLAAAYKDPRVTYANYLADINFLLQLNDFKFINSYAGRQWLGFYHALLSPELFDRGLAMINNYALEQLSLVAKTPAKNELAMATACGQIYEFERWRSEQWHLLRSPIDHRVKQRLIKMGRSADSSGTKENSENFDPLTQSDKYSKSNLSNLLDTMIVPLAAISRSPILASGLVFAARATIAMASASSKDVTNMLHTADASALFHDATDLNVQDITEAFARRSLQAEEQCQSRVNLPSYDKSWLVALGAELFDTHSYSVALKPNGNVAVVGRTRGFGAQDWDVVLAEFTSLGELSWAKMLGGIGGDLGSGLVALPDGSMLVCGSTGSVTPNTEMLFLRVNPEGVLIFNVAFINSGNDFGRDVTINHNRAMILIAEINSSGGNAGNLLAVQYASTGHLDWAKVLSSDKRISPQRLAVKEDNSVIVIGHTNSFDAEGGLWDTLLLQFDDVGNLDWATMIGGPGDDYAFSVLINHDGSFLFAGSTTSFSNGDSNGLIAACDASGQFLWAKSVGGGGEDMLGSLASKNNATLIVGHTSSFGFGAQDVLLLQIDNEGSLQWARALGGSDNDIGLDIAVQASGEIYIVGHTASFGKNSFSAGQFIGRLETENPAWNLPSDIGFISVEPHVKNITDSISSKPVIPTISATTPGLISWNSGSGEIGQNAVSYASANLNADAWPKIMNAHAMYHFSYTLPSRPYIFLESQPSIKVEILGGDWLRYDPLSRTLSGVPVLMPYEPVQIRLFMESVFVEGLGSFSFESFTLELCVQPPDFSNPVNFALFGGDLDDRVSFVTAKQDGSFIAVGRTQSFGAGQYDAFIANFSPIGELNWMKTLGGVEDDAAYRVSSRDDGKFVVVGQTANGGAGREDIFVAQFDVSGRIEWIRTFGGSDNELSQGLALRSNGSMVLFGQTASFNALEHDLLLFQLSDKGEVEWAYTFGGEDDEVGLAITTGQNDSVFVCGITKSYDAIDFDFLLAHVDANGLIMRAIMFGTESFDVCSTIDVTESGEIQVVGSTGGVRSGISDGLVMRLDQNLQLGWVKSLTTNKWVQLDRSEIKSDGKSIISGVVVDESLSSFDVLVMELSAEGDINWARSVGGEATDTAFGLSLTEDGNIVLVGDSENFGALGIDNFIAVLDSFGNLNMPGYEALQMHDLNAFTVISFYPAVHDITTNLTHSEVILSTSNFTEVTVNEVTAPNFRRVRFFSTSELRPVTNLPYGQEYLLDFKNVLGPTVLLLSISEMGKSFLPHWLSYEFETQILSGRPSGDVRGEYEITASLSLSGYEQQISFILNITNSVPHTEALAYNTTVGRFVFPLSGSFVDDEGDVIGPYGVAQVGGKLAPTIGSVDATTGRLFGTTLSGDQGSFVFNITADDPYGSGWQLITVNVLNTAPQQQFTFADPPPVTIGSQFTYSFPSNAFVDVDGDQISFQAEAPGFLEFNPIRRTLTGIPAESDRGVYATTIYANDPYGGKANVSISIIANAGPILQLNVDRFDTNRVGEPFSIPIPAGVFVDPDGDSVSYQLSEDVQHIKPSWLEFNPITSTMYGVPTSNTQQGYRLLFKVQDGRGGEAFYTPVLYVPNSPPQVVHPLPGITIPVDAAGAYPAPATVFFDPDDDTISYALNRISSGSEEWLFLVNNVYTYLPRSGDQGVYYFDFIGLDSYGGSASVPFSITVRNRPPVLVYDIPLPGEASASAPWRFDIESDNFLDDDRDPLVYTATRLDGQNLPEWIDFSSTRRTFSGQASGRDRGQLAVKVLVDDTFGGQAEGYFNLTVVNSLPRPKERLFDQQASSTDNALVFTVTSFEDPDDEAITYRAVSSGQTSLPNWIDFDPTTRTFTARPISALPGNYLLTLIATDAVGGQWAENFNLAIQPPPSIDEDSTKDLIQLLVPFLTGVSLLGAVIATMAGRSQRIRMTDQAIQAWAEQKHHDITPVGLQSFEALRSQLQEINRQLNSNNPLSEIEASLIEFGQMLQRYYAQTGVKLMPMTKLLNMRIVKTLTQYVRINILELHQAHSNAGETLDAARLLHFFLGLVLAEHTGRKNRLTHDLKDKYFGPLDRLIARLPTRTRADVSILHELESCREALVCMTDTNTLRVLCQTSLSHILSPGALVSDLKALIFNIPSTWYVTLLKLNQEAGQAAAEIPALHRLQECAASERDWRFRYGVVPILLSVITSARSDEIRKQAIVGERKHFRLRRLGLVHLLRARQSRVLRWRNRWVSRHAAWSLNQLAGKLDPKTKRLLNDYLDPQAMARTPASRRVSSITTPLESRALRVVAAGAGAGSSQNGVSFVSNPLRSGTRASGSRLKSWVGRRGVTPQHIRLAPASEKPGP